MGWLFTIGTSESAETLPLVAHGWTAGEADAAVAPATSTLAYGGSSTGRWMEGSCVRGRLLSLSVVVVTMG